MAVATGVPRASTKGAWSAQAPATDDHMACSAARSGSVVGVRSAGSATVMATSSIIRVAID